MKQVLQPLSVGEVNVWVPKDQNLYIEKYISAIYSIKLACSIPKFLSCAESSKERYSMSESEFKPLEISCS
jgi:hypothetical protein